jgi:tetratricopeptide (TPR) repeat protein
MAILILMAFSDFASSSTPRATVPPSSYQSGLTATPNPIDSSSNLPITGNVLGGKHFRGNIPYNSTTSFSAPLGSTSLDSFLRYSAVPDAQTGYLQNYSPFYSSTGTVTTTLPGYSGVFSPVSPRIAGGPGQIRTGQPLDMMTLSEAAGSQVSTSGSLGVQTSPRLGYAPMPTDSGGTEDSGSEAPGDLFAQRSLTPAVDSLMTPQEYQQRLDQLRQGIERMQAGLSQLQQNRDTDNAMTTQSPPQQPGQQSPPVPGQEAVSPAEPRLELYDPSAGRQATLAIPPVETEQADGSSGDQDPSGAVQSGTRSALQRVEEISRSLNRPPKEPSSANERPTQEIAEPGSAKPPVETMKASPNNATRTYENADSPTQKQFDQYLAAAQLHMQQGRYDRAADSFRLASVYIPHDPRPHFGKSLALLATGDSAGSAVSLTRAIELDARYALQKVDLVEILGGPELFVQRVSKLQEQVEAGNAPQLQFLLAYVYFQMHQVDEARNAIRAVKQAMPSSRAVGALSAAIDPTTAK